MWHSKLGNMEKLLTSIPKPSVSGCDLHPRDHSTDRLLSKELNSAEPSYLTNRAAAHMGLKRFRPALEDCQQAATLQQASPQPKTLLRLARCQMALGLTIAAASTIKDILSIESSNAQALQFLEKIKALEGHVKNFENARAKKEWGLARLALEKCLQAIEGEGGEVPTEWRIWRVELELVRGNWENANMAATYVVISSIHYTLNEEIFFFFLFFQ